MLSDNITGSVITNAFANTPYSNIANVAFFNNLLDTRTQGLELALKHDLNLEQYGKLNLNLGLAYNKMKLPKLEILLPQKVSEFLFQVLQDEIHKA